jgi:hypothetical protein
MTDTTLLSSPSLDISQDHFGEFKKHARGIGLKLLGKMLLWTRARKEKTRHTKPYCRSTKDQA